MTAPTILRRMFAGQHISRARDFTLWPQFFSPDEQTILLRAALQKLDLAENRLFRKRRKAFGLLTAEESSIKSLFYPDDYYDFQEVSFIHQCSIPALNISNSLGAL
jgi:hypothetical protein